jgi:hypothetical protein
MGVLPALWAVLAPWLLGIPVVRALGLRPRDDAVAFLGWSFCSGALALGVLLFLALLLGVPTRWFWVLPFTGLLLLPLLRGEPGPAGGTGCASLGWLLGVGAVVALAGLRVLAGSARPCIESDEGNIWSLKAKTLFTGLGADFGPLQVFNLHPDYPLLDPLLQTWVYALHGGIVHFENRWPVMCFVPALLLIAAAALRRQLPPLPAFLVLLLLWTCADLQMVALTAYADGMLACGLLLALDGWLRWRAGDGAAHRRLGALGVAIAAWSKNEAAMYLGALAVAAAAVALWQRRVRPAALLPWLGPALAVWAVQWGFNAHFGLHNDLLGHNPTGKGMAALFLEQFADRAMPILVRAGHEVIAPGSVQGAILLLVPLALLWSWRRAPALRVPGLALLLALLGVHLVYIGSFLGLKFHMDTSYTRVLFQLLPAALLWLAALVPVMLPRPAVAPATS